MNKKTYEAPEMVKRMIATASIAADATASDDNEFSSDDFWN
jgi:hypothetical protein